MNKKKTKKTAGKKSAKKRSGHKKGTDPAQVREEIAGIVKSGAINITAAVMDQAMHGELAPAKYLFEMAGVYPPASDGTQATEEEDCLAKTLLDRVGPAQKAPDPASQSESSASGANGAEPAPNRGNGTGEQNNTSVV